MNVLVTGGAGYIGSHAVRRLLRAGHAVTVYDSLELGHEAALPEGLLIVGTLDDSPKITRVLKDRAIDGVIHFAGRSRVSESMSRPDLYYSENVAGTLSVLEAMRAAGTRKIVFSSSCATYGIPEHVPIGEGARQMPVNPYGWSKLVVERMLADYASAFGFSYASLRYFNACGASPDGDLGEDHAEEPHLIPIALQVALGQRDYIEILGSDYPTEDGTCVRDYVHVDDLADAHVIALQKLSAESAFCLNLGTGKGHSVREVIDSCRRITGHPIPERVAPRRAGDPPILVADPRQACELLGWSPAYTSIDAMITTAWGWHREHPTGYRQR